MSIRFFSRVSLSTIVLSTLICYGQPSVLTIANTIDYYDHVRNLRSKSIDHLLALETIMKDKIDALRASGHEEIADVKEREYRDIQTNISDDFDHEFDTFDRRIILAGDVLDERGALLGEKRALIASNLQGLTSSINYLITKYSPQTLG